MPTLSNCIGASVSLPLKTIEHKSLPIQPQKEKVKVVPRANGVENAVKYSPGRKVKCTPTPLLPYLQLEILPVPDGRLRLCPTRSLIPPICL